MGLCLALLCVSLLPAALLGAIGLSWLGSRTLKQLVQQQEHRVRLAAGPVESFWPEVLKNWVDNSRRVQAWRQSCSEA